MPIEELARRTDMTVRNLRAMHARELLPPPELVGRKGFYTERHVARVLLVRKLQSRGFSLAAIHALIQSWEAGSGLVAVMGLEDSLLTPGVPEAKAEADAAAIFPELLEDRRALEKALAQELVVKRGERFVAPDAELLDLVKQQAKAGFPILALLEEGDRLTEDMNRIAGRLRQSFFEHVVNRYLEPGRGGAGVADVAEKVALLRPIAVRVVSILLARAIERGGGPAIDAKGEATGERRPRARSGQRRRGARGAKKARRVKKGKR